MMRRHSLFLLLALTLAAAACARGVSIGTDPSPVYTVDVHNATRTEISVFYAVDGGERVLGNVSAGSTERFVIAGSVGPSVRIIARPAAGQGIYGPYDLILGAGETRRVVVSGGAPQP